METNAERNYNKGAKMGMLLGASLGMTFVSLGQSLFGWFL